MGKSTKPDARFRSGGGTRTRNCRICTYMLDDGHCEKVAGLVKPEDVCERYFRKAAGLKAVSRG